MASHQGNNAQVGHRARSSAESKLPVNDRELDPEGRIVSHTVEGQRLSYLKEQERATTSKESSRTSTIVKPQANSGEPNNSEGSPQHVGGRWNDSNNQVSLPCESIRRRFQGHIGTPQQHETRETCLRLALRGFRPVCECVRAMWNQRESADTRLWLHYTTASTPTGRCSQKSPSISALTNDRNILEQFICCIKIMLDDRTRRNVECGACMALLDEEIEMHLHREGPPKYVTKSKFRSSAERDNGA